VRPAPLATVLKRLLRVGRVVADTPHGTFAVDPVTGIGAAVLRGQPFEPDTMSVLEAFLEPGATFVDVGANEGYFSVAGARLVGPRGRVVAVEPQSRLRPVIERNAALNGIENITIYGAAISDAAGTAELHLTSESASGSSSLFRTTRYALPSERVPTMTLAQLFADAGVERADLVKVDVEGFEYEALLGSPELLRRGAIRTLVLEWHPSVLAARGLDGGRIAALLAETGYREDPRFECNVYRAPA